PSVTPPAEAGPGRTVTSTLGDPTPQVDTTSEYGICARYSAKPSLLADNNFVTTAASRSVRGLGRIGVLPIEFGGRVEARLADGDDARPIQDACLVNRFLEMDRHQQ